MADRSSIRAFLNSLPTDLRMRARMAYVDGIANAVCALLPWLLPPTLAAIVLLAARLLIREPDTAIVASVFCFIVGIPIAFRMVRAVELSVLCLRIQTLRRGQLPRCPKCLYDQQGATTDRCPECGSTTRFVPTSRVAADRVAQ